MKDYLHRHFMKFYYNGIFLEMKKKAEGEKPTKVVKSKRFSSLIDKFNSTSNTNNNTNKFERKLGRNMTTTQKTAIGFDGSNIKNNIKRKTTILEDNNE